MHLEILLIAIVVSTACVIPGVFLVLRKVALMSDAISHAILLGIVGAFFVVKNLHSPLLIVGAALSGLLTVMLTEVLIRSNLIKKDAAIGLIFPVFFSIGVILINVFASNVHLDNDAVLLGEIALAPLDRLIVNGIDIGPKSLWVMIPILLVNMTILGMFYKELKLTSFDPGLASSLGFFPAVVNYILMAVVSITAVGAFDAVGSILVVALMITPPATAYLLSKRVSTMVFLSVVFGVLSAVVGYGVAVWLDVSIAGMMATITGVLFVIVLFFSSPQGLVFKYLNAKHQRINFAAKMLVVQLLYHEGTENEAKENSFENLINHMEWTERFAKNVTRYALQERYIQRNKNQLKLTPLGREVARSALTMS